MPNKNWESMTLAQLRKEYSKQRSIFRKRVERLSEKGGPYAKYAAPFLKGGKLEFKPLEKLDALPRIGYTELSLKKEMIRRLQDLDLYMSKDRLSLSGWKEIEKATIKSLQEAGYNITKANIKQFGEYMEVMRAMFGNKIFPSSEVAEAYDNISEGERINSVELYNLIGGFRSSNGGIDLFL